MVVGWEQHLCLDDPDKVTLQGSLWYSLSELKYLELSLKKANCGSDQCASDQEIRELMDSNIIRFDILASTVTFDQDQYQQNPIIRKTFSKSKTIEADKVKNTAVDLQKHYVESDDERMSLGLNPARYEYFDLVEESSVIHDLTDKNE